MAMGAERTRKPGRTDRPAIAAVAGQTELFPAGQAASLEPPAPLTETPSSLSPPPATTPPENPADRAEAIRMLLEACAPVRAGSRAASWLKARRVFKKTWDAQGLRSVDHYARAAEGLLGRFPIARLAAWGLFNKDGHLRFYRHSLLIPWFDGDRAAYLQARAPDPTVTPGELSLTGAIPCPYNARLLDGSPGRLYLCDGALNTLAVLEAGFPAVGVPEGTGLRSAWLARFRGKSVYLAYGADAAGEAAAAKDIALLTGRGIEAHRLRVPAGKDVGEWLAGK
jgi:DNA primase